VLGGFASRETYLLLHLYHLPQSGQIVLGRLSSAEPHLLRRPGLRIKPIQRRHVEEAAVMGGSGAARRPKDPFPRCVPTETDRESLVETFPEQPPVVQLPGACGYEKLR